MMRFLFAALLYSVISGTEGNVLTYPSNQYLHNNQYQYPQPVQSYPAASPSQYAESRCSRFVEGRVYCGTDGIQQWGCERMGCCWDDSRPGLYNCFYHHDMAKDNNSPTAHQNVPQTPPDEPMFVPPSSTVNIWPQQNAAVQPVQTATVPAKIGYSGCLLHCTSLKRRQRRVCVPKVSKDVCMSLGCCFDETEPDDTKSCFHSNPIKDTCPVLEMCKLPYGPSEQCGRPGIDKYECEAQDCCYNDISRVPTCYRKQGGNSHVVGTPVPAVETTTKMDLLKKLQELEAILKRGKSTTKPLPPKNPTLQTYQVEPKAAGLVSSNVASVNYQYQPYTQPQPPIYTLPTTPPPQYRQQCYFGFCQYVLVPTQAPPNCFPRQCGDPRYTPEKVKTDFDPRKIVGGSRAFPFSHPWTVMMQKIEGNRTFICGAALICRQWLVTAAHCLDQQSSYKPTPDLDPNMYIFFIGRWAGWQSPHGAQVQVFKGYQDIERLFQHENFIPGKHRGVITHDIALVKLRKQVRMSDHVQPACLPTEQAPPRKIMFATGWGIHRNQGPKPTTLKQVGVEIKTQEACRNRVPGFVNPPGVICAGGEPNHDTCTGDSGGPLVGSKPQRSFLGTTKQIWFLYGLTSIGSPSCNTQSYDRQPALYTDVFYYLNWIKARTSNCCG